MYAAAIYLRVESKDGIATHLLFARARTAPIRKNQLTIPRLELLATVIATRMLTTVRAALEIPESSPAMFWIDSRCVLAWLKTTNTVTTFVRNRVKEIREISNAKFRYVPSAHNIADLPSRTCTTDDLRHNVDWWCGPQWLAQSECDWPPETESAKYDSPCELESEMEVTALVVVPRTNYSPFEMRVENYNSYIRLIRVTALCVSFLRKFRGKCKQFADTSVSSFEYALNLWIKTSQLNAYSDIFEKLNNKNSPPSRAVRNLRPRIDAKGLLRYGGRLPNAPIPEQAKFPILMPKATQDHFVVLILLHIHTSLKHGGTSQTLLHFQQKYWMPCGKQQTYSALLKCYSCAREMAQPYEQPTISDLPAFRLQANEPPFSAIGLDTCGPFKILDQNKYVLLVTCLVIRGVALEVLDSLETNHVHAALKRIEARRSPAKFYLSDNAPQYLLLKQHIEKNNVEEITWKFIPEYTPWTGGVYERLNRMLKTSFYRCFRESPFCGPVQFRTMIAEIEAAINSRPLTSVPATPNDEILTPNHFLKVRCPTNEVLTIAPVSNTKAAKALVEISRRSNEIINQFWRHWKTSYLQHLQQRPATQKFQNKYAARLPRIGDVVIIRDDLRKRAYWKLGKIVQLNVSDDLQVRSAQLKVGSGKITVRPLKDLFFLELNEYDDQKDPVPPQQHPAPVHNDDVEEEIIEIELED